MSYKIILCDQCQSINKVKDSYEQNLKPHCGKCGATLSLKGDVKTVSAQKLQKIIAHANLPVVVDIYADWCGPCKMYSPIFKEVAIKNRKKAEFFKLDSEKDPQFSTQYGVRGIPTTLIFENGVFKSSQSGLLNAKQLESLINS